MPQCIYQSFQSSLMGVGYIHIIIVIEDHETICNVLFSFGAKNSSLRKECSMKQSNTHAVRPMRLSPFPLIYWNI